MRSSSDAARLATLAIAGLLCGAVGLRPVFFVAAVVLLAAGAGGLLLRPLRNIEWAAATSSTESSSG